MGRQGSFKDPLVRHPAISQRHLDSSFPQPAFLNFSRPMYSRLSHLARHFSRPLPGYAHYSASTPASINRVMTSSSADDRNSRTIHTAACLIIGDEVLGGKVCTFKGSQNLSGNRGN